jgi:hypothetical protein
MEFWVKLIEVTETRNGEAREDLNANCTHVGNDYWLFEGDEEALNDGISFNIVGEEAIEGYGDLSGSKLKKMVREIYNVDKCFLD